jgi:uncharacterized protein (DUF58 family)
LEGYRHAAEKLIARQYEDERREHLLILIDAGRQLTAEIDGVPRIEAAIDASGSTGA